MAQLQPRANPIRFRYLFLVAVVFGGSFLLLSISSGPELVFLGGGAPSRPARPSRPQPADRFTIDTDGCTIPALHAFDESVKKFVEYPKHLKPCPHMNSSLLGHNDTHIWINLDNLHYYNLSKDYNISCCYKAFYRPASIADIFSRRIDDRVEYRDCIEFDDVIEVINEFVKITCYDIMERNIYDQFFLFAPKKPLFSYKEDSTEFVQNQSSYNVIVLGIDAVSRLNFYRTMPKTLSFLKKKGAIELLGYNKVGDNTFPNLTPMLLGVRDTDLKKICWPNTRNTFDNCPFIWEWYKEAGFYTALGEDSASLGTFNFEKYGFAGSPTTYYLHTFMREAETKAGNNRDFNSYLCMGNRYFYNVLLDYITSLTTTLRSSKLFGFFWEVTMSHDYLNYPMVMDDSYELLFKQLDASRYLDNTVFILLSDHGIRWGDIRFTKQGRLEERLPLVHILLPPSFQQNYSLAYDNLKMNTKRLTTPFDMFATLSDLVNLDAIKDEKIVARCDQPYAEDRSISLFLPIPRNRTCRTAGIDDHWCTCHKGRKLHARSSEAKEAAQFMVSHMNKLLEVHGQCARLALDEVLEATEMEAGTPGAGEDGWRELLVVARAAPGGGVFEATLRRTARAGRALPGAPWALAGSVSRLNLYGDQSRCVHHYQLKLYCFCH